MKETVISTISFQPKTNTKTNSNTYKKTGNKKNRHFN